MAELVRGSVTDRPWGRTFATFGLRGVTGQLAVFSDGKRFLVAFERGAVVAAASPLASDAAVRVALTGHLLSSTQVPEISRRQAAAPDRDEVSVIAELARLGPDHALRLRRRVIAQRAARTFSLNHGDFVVTDRTELPVVAGCELDIRAVVYMGARTNLPEQRLTEELGRLGAWFRLKSGLADDLPQFGFGELEQPILERLREGGTIAELEEFAASFVDETTVRAVVYALASCNACDVVVAEPGRARGRSSPQIIAPPVSDDAEPAAEDVEPDALEEPAASEVDRAPAPATRSLHATPSTTPPPVPARTSTSSASTPAARSRSSPSHVSTVPMPTIAPAPDPPRDLAGGRTTRQLQPASGRQGERTGSASGSYALVPLDESSEDELTPQDGSSVAYGSDPALRPSPGPVRRGGGSDPALRPRGDSDPATRSSAGATRDCSPNQGARGSKEEETESARRRLTRSGILGPATRSSAGAERPRGEPDPATRSSAGVGRPRGDSDPATRSSAGGGRDVDPAAQSSAGVGRPRGDSDPAARSSAGGTRDFSPNQGARVPEQEPDSAGPRRLTGPQGAESSPQLVVRRMASSRPAPVRRVSRSESPQSHEVKALIAQRLKLLDQGADHFMLLGVAHDVATDALRKAYFALARQLHPDRLAALGISDDGKHAQRLFAQINTAFAILADPPRRAKYLHVLRRGGEGAIRAEQARAEEMASRIMDAEEAFHRGELALRRDQPRAAIPEFELAVQLNPEEAEYHALLAWSHFCAAPDKAAIAAKTRALLEKAIQRAPKAVAPRFCLGRVERMLGRDQEALRYFRDVLAAMPGHADAAAEVRVLESKLGGGDKSGGGVFGRTKR